MLAPPAAVPAHHHTNAFTSNTSRAEQSLSCSAVAFQQQYGLAFGQAGAHAAASSPGEFDDCVGHGGAQHRHQQDLAARWHDGHHARLAFTPVGYEHHYDVAAVEAVDSDDDDDADVAMGTGADGAASSRGTKAQSPQDGQQQHQAAAATAAEGSKSSSLADSFLHSLRKQARRANPSHHHHHHHAPAMHQRPDDAGPSRPRAPSTAHSSSQRPLSSNASIFSVPDASAHHGGASGSATTAPAFPGSSLSAEYYSPLSPATVSTSMHPSTSGRPDSGSHNAPMTSSSGLANPAAQPFYPSYIPPPTTSRPGPSPSPQPATGGHAPQPLFGASTVRHAGGGGGSHHSSPSQQSRSRPPQMDRLHVDSRRYDAEYDRGIGTSSPASGATATQAPSSPQQAQHPQQQVRTLFNPDDPSRPAHVPQQQSARPPKREHPSHTRERERERERERARHTATQQGRSAYLPDHKGKSVRSGEFVAGPDEMMRDDWTSHHRHQQGSRRSGGPSERGSRRQQQPLQGVINGDAPRQLFDPRKDDPLRFAQVGAPYNAALAQGQHPPPPPMPQGTNGPQYNGRAGLPPGSRRSTALSSVDSETRSLASTVITLGSLRSTDGNEGTDRDAQRERRHRLDANPFVVHLRAAYKEIKDLEQALEEDGARMARVDAAAFAANNNEARAPSPTQHRGNDPTSSPVSAGPSSAGPLKISLDTYDDNFWIQLVNRHKKLADLYYSFMQMTLDPRSSPQSVHQLPQKYQIPSRMWQIGFQLPLERMRQAIGTAANASLAAPASTAPVSPGLSIMTPASAAAPVSTSPATAANPDALRTLDHMIDFVQYAYAFYTQLFEDATVAVFRAPWLEQLGDLARFRMAVANLAHKLANRQQLQPHSPTSPTASFVNSSRPPSRNAREQQQRMDFRRKLEALALHDDDVEHRNDGDAPRRMDVDEENDDGGETEDGRAKKKKQQHQQHKLANGLAAGTRTPNHLEPSTGERAAKASVSKAGDVSRADGAQLGTPRGPGPGARDDNRPSIGVPALNDWDVDEQETWRETARDWYDRALRETPGNGRLQHHLALLSQDDPLRNLYHFVKSLTSSHPYPNARESVMGIFDDTHQRERSRPDVSKEELFVNLHGMLFTNIALDDFDETFERLIERLNEEGFLLKKAGYRWRDVDADLIGDAGWSMMAVCNIAAVMQYGNDKGIIQRYVAKSQSGPPSRAAAVAAAASGQPMAPRSIMRAPSSLRHSETAESDSPMDVDGADNSAFEDNGVEDTPLAFRCACKLTFGLLRWCLKRPTRDVGGMQCINPYIVLVLTFLGQVALIPSAVRVLEREVPWRELVEFFNLMPDTIEIAGDGGSSKLTGGALPEDWTIRGMDWAGRALFARGYWRTRVGASSAAIAAAAAIKGSNEPWTHSGHVNGTYFNVESELGALEFDIEDVDNSRRSGTNGGDESAPASVHLADGRWRRMAVVSAWLAVGVPGFDVDSSRRRFSLQSPLEDRLWSWQTEDAQLKAAEDMSRDAAAESENREASLSPELPVAVEIAEGLTALVVDANILLAALDVVLLLVESWTVVVPLAVVLELDRLRNGSPPLSAASNQALAFLDSQVVSNDHVRVQTSRGNYLRDLAFRHEAAAGVAMSGLQDEILRAAAWQQEHHEGASSIAPAPAVLVSNDAHLRIKARMRGIDAIAQLPSPA